MKAIKSVYFLLALSMVIFAAYGCDEDNICSESVYVSDTREARVYYPCDISAPTPATTMCSGYIGDYDDIEFLSEAVTASGYVVLAFTPTTEYGFVEGWKDAHKSSIAELQDMNENHSVLSGKIDTNKLQTSGHSKGGGGAIQAAAELGDSVSSSIGMAPYQGMEFYDFNLRNMTAATFVQAAGIADYLATPSMTEDEYDALPDDISKCYKRHSAWGHFEWTGLSTTYHDTLSEEVIAWMRYYLSNDTSMEDVISDRTGVGQFEWNK